MQGEVLFLLNTLTHTQKKRRKIIKYDVYGTLVTL